MKGKHSKRKAKSIKKRKLLSSLFMIIFIVTMIVSGVNIFIWFKENKQNSSILSEINASVQIDENQEKSNKYNVDFATLKQKNQDTVAWIKVYGTDIEYPVVKTSNNDYYLTHSFDKSYNSAGWVFMDYKNKLDSTDKNIVIYAHNRKDGSMFDTLKNILNSDWQNNKDNLIIPFITENKKEEYEVFSVYTIESEEYYITTNFNNTDEFETFINKVKSRSKKDFGVNVTPNDKILTLSTCANDNRYRVVLHAVKREY